MTITSLVNDVWLPRHPSRTDDFPWSGPARRGVPLDGGDIFWRATVRYIPEDTDLILPHRPGTPLLPWFETNHVRYRR